jgi:hypothetical protein
MLLEVLGELAINWDILYRKFGTFESDAVILQIGTHDLLQPTNNSTGVNDPLMRRITKPLCGNSRVFQKHVMPLIVKCFGLEFCLKRECQCQIRSGLGNMQRFDDSCFGAAREYSVVLCCIFAISADLLTRTRISRSLNQVCRSAKSFKKFQSQVLIQPGQNCRKRR